MKVRTIHLTPASVALPMAARLIEQPMVADTTDYFGPVIHRRGGERTVRYEGGYATLDPSTAAPDFYHYVTDYQGNNRGVIHAASGQLVQVTHYYPFGAVYADMGTGAHLQPFKHGDKELDMMHGLCHYDYLARPYDPILCTFTRPDSRATSYPHISPRAFCTNNPVNYIDPDGNEFYKIEDSDLTTIICKLIFKSSPDLSESQNNAYRIAISVQFSKIFEENSNGIVRGVIEFVDQKESIQQTLELCKMTIGYGGSTYNQSSIVQILNNDKSLRSPDDLALDAIHEILHVGGLNHPNENLPPDDTAIEHIGGVNYHSYPTTSKEIIDNIMNYPFYIIDGKKSGLQNKLTPGQIKTIIDNSLPMKL